MSILMDVLKEEYDRLERQKRVYQTALIELPKGYISKKNIRGNPSYYLQWRENGKMVSKYISKKDLPEIEKKIKKRKMLEDSLHRVAEDQWKLRKVLEV